MESMETLVSTNQYDVIIVGGGIVGLGIGVGLLKQDSRLRVVVLESGHELAMHGSGRNSGVLHAGFYYSPDSLKAKLTARGNEKLRQLCSDEEVRINEVGKVVVTTKHDEIPRLHNLAERAMANGVDVRMISEMELKKLEPCARTVEAAIWSPRTAVANPSEVTEAVSRVFIRLGGELKLNSKVGTITDRGVVLAASNEEIFGRHVVNAAGLYADQLAHAVGAGTDYEILPFKGIYLYGNETAPALQRHVYPVPDPRNPFLGVHLTVTVDGKSKVGPTAIPAFSRLNYSKFGGIKPNELWSVLTTLPKFLFSDHHDGAGLIRSEVPKYLRSVLVNQAKALVPTVKPSQYDKWGKTGIRAQLFNLREKRLEMDFVVETAGNQTHVLNAVSPAWTGSLSFGEYVAASVVRELQS
jgi:L-2-hydroxyglutarate oxidase LhgO